MLTGNSIITDNQSAFVFEHYKV